MKYIVYIFFIAFIATVGFLYSSGSTPDVGDSAVRIDGRTISVQEIEKLKQQSPSLFEDSDGLPESLILREILISEALRQKVDQEEAFRHRVKTFYEQSLVKILVERKMDSINYTPTTEEIALYADFLGRSVEIDLVPVDSAQKLGNDIEKLSGPFGDFSVALRMEMLFLETGVASKPVNLFGQLYVLIVKSIGEKDPLYTQYDAGRDRAVIQEYRRQEIMAQWQQSLMEQAEIVIAPKQEEQGN